MKEQLVAINAAHFPWPVTTKILKAPNMTYTKILRLRQYITSWCTDGIYTSVLCPADLYTHKLLVPDCARASVCVMDGMRTHASIPVSAARVTCQQHECCWMRTMSLTPQTLASLCCTSAVYQEVHSQPVSQPVLSCLPACLPFYLCLCVNVACLVCLPGSVCLSVCHVCLPVCLCHSVSVACLVCLPVSVCLSVCPVPVCLSLSLCQCCMSCLPAWISLFVSLSCLSVYLSLSLCQMACLVCLSCSVCLSVCHICLSVYLCCLPAWFSLFVSLSCLPVCLSLSLCHCGVCLMFAYLSVSLCLSIWMLLVCPSCLFACLSVCPVRLSVCCDVSDSVSITVALPFCLSQSAVTVSACPVSLPVYLCVGMGGGGDGVEVVWSVCFSQYGELGKTH